MKSFNLLNICLLFGLSLGLVYRASAEAPSESLRVLTLNQGDRVLVDGYIGHIVEVFSGGSYAVRYRVNKQNFEKVLNRQYLRKQIQHPAGAGAGLRALVGSEVGRVLDFFEGGWIRFLPEKEEAPGTEYSYRRDYDNPENDPAIIALGPTDYSLTILSPVTPIGTVLSVFDSTRLERVFANGFIQISFIAPYRHSIHERARLVVSKERYPRFDFGPREDSCLDLLRRN